MDFLNTRKRLLIQRDRIADNASHLRKLTDQVPGCVFQLQMTSGGAFCFDFVSEGIRELHPSLNPQRLLNDSNLFFNCLQPDDRSLLYNSLIASSSSFNELNVQFQTKDAIPPCWFWAKAKPERKGNDTVTWYGFFQNITDTKQYEADLEQICFDISHILRRPITTMLALTKAIEKNDLQKDQLLAYVGYLKTVSEEMDNFTRRLNKVYYEKKERFSNHLR